MPRISFGVAMRWFHALIPAYNSLIRVFARDASGNGTHHGDERIVLRMGSDFARLIPTQDRCADSGAMASNLTATHFPIPVTATQINSGILVGAGASIWVSVVRRNVVKDTANAWVLTLPAAAVIGVLASGLFT